MKRSRIVLIVCLTIGGAVGVFSAMQPPVYLERSVEINAPTSIVEEKVNAIKKNIDSAALSQFKFDYKSQGAGTLLVWGFKPQGDDNDEVMLKLYWMFKKDNMTKEMDSGLMNIKRISEKASQEDSVHSN